MQGPGHVRILGTVTGLTPGKHGFHVHAKGATGDNCKVRTAYNRLLRKLIFKQTVRVMEVWLTK